MFYTTRHILGVSLTLALATLLSVGAANANAEPLSGDDVRGVQQTLHNIGYRPGKIDGVMGPRTRSAIRQYQQDNNLPLTGRLDAETARRVEEARRTRSSDRQKFQGMDTNNDGVITRQEYRGNDQSFANHDWNNDGVLSGNELTPGAHRPAHHARTPAQTSAGGDFKAGGKEVGRGSKEAAHEMTKGKPVASGKEFGKGVGRFGEKVGEGVKKAVSPESDRGNREKDPR
jgi:hypothetical protein